MWTMRTARDSDSARGLTILEALIVLGVIALIAAIAFPLLLGAKRRAQIATCTGNLSQIGKALAMYAAEHDETLPPYWLHSVDIEYGATQNRYKILAKPKEWRECLAEYGVASEQFWCPLDSHRGTECEAVHNWPGDRRNQYTSYDTVALASEQFVDPDAQTWVVRLSALQQPSDMVYLFDHYWENIEPAPIGEEQRVTMWSAHGDGTNILYYDWHIEHHRIGEW